MPVGSESNFDYLTRIYRTYGAGSILVELLLICGAVYVGLRFLRGTHGARLLTVLVFALMVLHVAVAWTAERWNLQRLEFLYERFLLLVTFCSIVIFQPELRRALSRLSEARFLRTSREEFTAIADELHDAIRSF